MKLRSKFLTIPKRINLRNSAIIVLSCLGASAYQNCSGGFKALSFSPAESTSSSSSPAGPVSGTPGNLPVAAFSAGDPFDYSKVPYKSQQMQAYLRDESYPGETSGNLSALAIAQNGMGAMYFSKPGSSQDSVDYSALASCSVVSRLPCALLARGATFAIGANDLDQSFNFKFTPGVKVGINMNPADLGNTNRDSYAYYGSAPSPKAMAIDQLGNALMVANDDPNYNMSTSGESQRRALELCEIATLTPPCSLYAVDDLIVYNASKINVAPAIDYTRHSVAVNIPGQTDAYFSYLMKNQYSLVPTYHLSVAISPDGNAASAIDVPGSDTTSRVLAECNQAAGDSSCFIYSQDLSVVMTAHNLYGFANYKDLFCLGTVRDSCQSHRLMGCTDPGSYYVLQNETPVLTHCN